MFQFPANPTPGQEFSAGLGITYQWDGTGWMAIKASGSAIELLAPPGVVMPYAGASPFTGWLLCDGKLYATDSLPGLFAVIGYTYGGSGANFNVPDLRGRVIAGIDNMGGAAAGRLTATVASTLGGAGGSEEVILTEATMPAHAHSIADVTHSHSLSDPGHGHGVADPTHTHGAGGSDILALDANSWSLGDWEHRQMNSHYTRSVKSIGGGPAATGISINSAGTGISIAAGGTGLSTTNSAGGGGSGGGHLNVQPTIALNFIIKT